jgi:uncharacterized protein (TIGR02145 family)
MKKNIFLILSLLLVFGCSSGDSDSKKDETASQKKLPTVTTKPIVNITTKSAASGGEIVDNGNDPIIKSGIVYSVNSNPTLDNGTVVNATSNEVSFQIDISNLQPNTTYNLRAFAANTVGVSYGSNVTFKTGQNILTIITKPITFDRVNSILSGGDITSSTPILGRGICISTLPNASTPATSDGAGDGSYISRSPTKIGTTYYIRAYAYDASNTIVYGNEIQYTTLSAFFTNGNGVKDYDGNNYPTFKINNQEWMQKNLDVSHFRNGDVIPQVQDDVAWFNAKTPAWCYYENKTANGVIFGKLYNHYAVEDPRGLAPAGWHIPTIAEYTKLLDFLGLSGTNFLGGSLKETGSSHWESPNEGATNISGFTALPGGIRQYTVDNNNNPVSAIFDVKGRAAWFWCSDFIQADLYRAISMENSYNSNSHISFGAARMGLSIRCIKD